MNRLPPHTTATAIAVLCVAAAVTTALIWFLHPTSSSAATQGTVARKAQVAQQNVLSALGPGSTLHFVIDGHFTADRLSVGGLPEDRTIDESITVGSNGSVVQYRSTIIGHDGVLYQTTVASNGEETITDERTGISRTFPFDATADQLQQSFDNEAAKLRDLVNSNSSVQVVPYQDGQAYLLPLDHPDGSKEHLYIDTVSFRLVHTDATDAAGAELLDVGFPVFEISNNPITPSPVPPPTATASSPTDTPLAGPTGAATITAPVSSAAAGSTG